ncbi:MAG: type II secretion system F family protein [Cyanobacteria bacterium NC_groundwater_1444_Ag_S-0.65um_54_12]|nr:type II secretion system F family protein [Cyanobacteria bacterium NC_groundwater_1444_Ag_S-0.65um_54_12]
MDLRLLLVFLLAFLAAGLIMLVLARHFQRSLVAAFEKYRARRQRSLERSRNPLSSERFVRYQWLFTISASLLGLALAPGILPRLFLGGLLGGLAWLACDSYLKLLWQRYQKEFEQQLPDMIGVIANAVKASFSVQQALELVTGEFTEPMSVEVTEVLQEIRMGIPFDQALQNWSERLKNDDLDIFTTALIIQRQTGSNLSEILDNLATTMRERRRIQNQIRTLTTQGRFSGTILSLLPIGLYLILYLIAPERMGVLFTHPLGWMLIVVCGVMILAGSLIIRHIVALDI